MVGTRLFIQQIPYNFKAAPRVSSRINNLRFFTDCFEFILCSHTDHMNHSPLLTQDNFKQLFLLLKGLALDASLNTLTIFWQRFQIWEKPPLKKASLEFVCEIIHLRDAMDPVCSVSDPDPGFFADPDPGFKSPDLDPSISKLIGSKWWFL